MLHKQEKKRLALSLYRQWESHPVTRQLRQILKDIYAEDAAELTTNLNLRRSCDEIALQMAEFKGRQSVLEKIIDTDRLKEDLLDTHVQWEE